jgi:hypothetical protein
MKAMERQVTAQVQKKCTALAKGCDALVAVSAAMAEHNKENVRVMAKRTSKRKALAPKQQSQSNRKKPKHDVSVGWPTLHIHTIPETPTKKTLPMCNYGCSHGGLVELKQMMPHETKYYLEKGNYFHCKSCKDCSVSIEQLFKKSKEKGLLYYCTDDFRRAELDEENAEFATTPCACILCIPCYFSRDTKKNEAAGTATRSSGRGRKQAT